MTAAIEQTGIMDTNDRLSFSDNSIPFKEQVSLCFEDPYMKNTFSEIKPIGHGGYGTVYSARHNHDKKIYALKIIPLLEGDDEDKLKTEVEVLSKISEHENIVGYNNSWIIQCNVKPTDTTHLSQNEQSTTSSEVTSEMTTTTTTSSTERREWTGKMFIIQMEYCEQTLKQFIDREKPSPSKTEAIERILRDILAGMKYFHAQKVVHRDLTPTNIFLDTFGKAKIGDFGLAKVMENEPNMDHDGINIDEECGLTVGLGTYLYRAPEIKGSCQQRKVKYDKRVDLYSLGVIIFEMHYLFGTTQERIHVLENLRKSIVFPKDFEERVERYPEIYKEMIVGLMNKDPCQRYSLERIEALLGGSDTTRQDSTRHDPSTTTCSQDIPDEPVSTDILPGLSKAVGACEWFEDGLNSFCFPIGNNLIITVLPEQLKTNQLKNCSLKFPLTDINGHDLCYDQNTISSVWKSDVFQHCQIAILELKPRGRTHFPFKPKPIERYCLHSSKQDFFYFNETTSQFLKICPKKLIDIAQTDTDISPEHTYFFDVTTSNSNVGAPVVKLCEDKTVKYIGIITQSVYQRGKNIGTVFVGLSGIFETKFTSISEKFLNRKVFRQQTSHASNCLKCQVEILRDENASLKKKVAKYQEELKNADMENSKLRSQMLATSMREDKMSYGPYSSLDEECCDLCFSKRRPLVIPYALASVRHLSDRMRVCRVCHKPFKFLSFRPV